MSDLPHNLLDETIHQRTRLAIMSLLAGVDALEFNEVKAQLQLTDGNLSTHLGALQRAGYVTVTKAFKGKLPQTTVAMAPRGRIALQRYIRLLQSILDQAK